MKDKELKIHKMQLDNTYIIEPVKENIVLMTKSAYMSLLKRIKAEARHDFIIDEIKKLEEGIILSNEDTWEFVLKKHIEQLKKELKS